MMRRILASLGLMTMLSLSTVVPAQAMPVAAPVTQFAACANGLQEFFSIRPWYACLEGAESGEPQIHSLSDLFLIIFPVVDSLVKIAAMVAVAYIFWMIIKIILARGDSGKVAQASHGIRDAVIGLVIALIAVVIVNFISTTVQGGS